MQPLGKYKNQVQVINFGIKLLIFIIINLGIKKKKVNKMQNFDAQEF